MAEPFHRQGMRARLAAHIREHFVDVTESPGDWIIEFKAPWGRYLKYGVPATVVAAATWWLLSQRPPV